MKGEKAHNLVVSDNLKADRIKGHPLVYDGNLVIDDRLEEEGTVKFFENLGGSVYMSMEPSAMENLVLIGSAELEDLGGKKLYMRKIFYEYGYDELWDTIADWISYFADFYGFSFIFLDLRKQA